MERDLMAIIKMQPIFGKNAHLVWAYIELFGITPMKAKTKKIRQLLEEMAHIFRSGGFTYQKKIYRVSEAEVAQALTIIVHRNFVEPLQNHRYLLKIMIGIAEASAKEAGKEEEKDLRKREERLRAGDRYPVPEEQVEPPVLSFNPSPSRGECKGGGERLTDAELAANKRRLQDMMKKIGG